MLVWPCARGSRTSVPRMSLEGAPPSWSFLTNHARKLVCIAHDPGIRLREIGAAVGITERAAHRIVGDLAASGYLSRERSGRRNRYTIRPDVPFPDPLVQGQRVGDFLALLTERPSDGAGGREPGRISLVPSAEQE